MGENELAKETYQTGIKKTKLVSFAKARNVYLDAIEDLEKLVNIEPTKKAFANQVITSLNRAKAEHPKGSEPVQSR